MKRTPHVLAVCTSLRFASCAVLHAVPTIPQCDTAVEMPIKIARRPKPTRAFLEIGPESDTFREPVVSGRKPRGTELVQRFATTCDGFANLSSKQSRANVLGTLLAVEVLVRSAETGSPDSPAPSSEVPAPRSEFGVSRFLGTVTEESVTKTQPASMLLPRLAKALPRLMPS